MNSCSKPVLSAVMVLAWIVGGANVVKSAQVDALGGDDMFDIFVDDVAYRIHVYTNAGMTNFTVLTGGEVEFLLVGGGGGGHYNESRGGGGAGGVVHGFTTLSSGTISVEVGSGGAGGVEASSTDPENGGDSVFAGIRALGGGAGGGFNSAGSDGGSGGGGGGRESALGGEGLQPESDDGGFGHDGGAAKPQTSPGSGNAGGGGGGAGGSGHDGVEATGGGAGGDGIQSSITGTNRYYAGGGGGGGGQGGGAGGLGGGGTGGHRSVSNATDGEPNTGGGGGGGAYDNSLKDERSDGGSGGSGILIIRYPAEILSFLTADPFTMADLQTGSTDYTNSNTVELVDFPIPEGYSEFQLTEEGDQSAVDPEGWILTNAIPEQIGFPQPAADTNIVMYAWFTNSSDTVSLRRAAGTMTYHKYTADVTARAQPYETTIFAGMQVVIDSALMNDGSSSSIGIHDLSIAAVEDETPADETVTFSEPGVYTVVLTAMDQAGNTDATTALVMLRDGVAPIPASFWEIPRDQMEARATSTYRENVPARALSDLSLWRTDSAPPQALIFDLRGRYPVGAFSLSSSSYRPKAYAVYVTDAYSTDAAEWGEPVAVGQLPDAADRHSVRFPSAEGRFLVLQFTDRYSTRIYIDEVELFAWRPFVLASPVTGDTHYSHTNTMDVVSFPILEGYDRYQVSAAGAPPGSTDPNWQIYNTNDLPATATFEAPDPEGEITLTAWFRDSTGTLSPTGFPSTITYVRKTADVQANVPSTVTAYAWDATFPAVVRAFDLRPQVPDQHAPYLGADAGAGIGLHALTVSCPLDETPERDDIVTLSRPGEYTVTFTATDRAGNRDIVPMTVTVKSKVAFLAGKRFTEDWTAPASSRSWPKAYAGRGPYPAYPPKIDWRIQWPQQWLIDYVSGERVTADLTVQSGPVGRSEPHQQLYAYIEDSGARDVDMRTDFYVLTTSGSHNPGLLARFHPRDWRAAANERRGYLLYMERTGPVSIQRISGGTRTTLASLSAVVLGGEWMTARFLVESSGASRTRLRAKVWMAGDPEPDEWMIETFDDTPALQTPGRLGIFGVTSSNRRFSLRDLHAIPLFRGTLIKMY